MHSYYLNNFKSDRVEKLSQTFFWLGIPNGDAYLRTFFNSWSIISQTDAQTSSKYLELLLEPKSRLS